MVKKIGNIFFAPYVFIGYAFITTLLYADNSYVVLRVTDVNGAAVDTVSVGVPFLVRLTIKDSNGTVSTPTISGLEPFERIDMRTSSQFTMINGRTSSEKSYLYTIRSHKPGRFVIGPAQVVMNGSSVASCPVELDVVSRSPKSDVQKKSDQPAYIMLSVNKKKIFVGEPLELTVNVMIEPEVQLAGQLAIDVAGHGWQVAAQTKPMQSQKVMNGKPYITSEQRIELYCYEPGPHTIPALTAQCLIPVRKRQREYSIFDLADFFGRGTESCYVQSNGEVVEVVDLPAFDKEPQAIGTINRFSASVNKSRAKVGEGIILTIELEGTGDHQRVKTPTLQLPESLTAYESKVDVQAPQRPGSVWKKIFEYIVQGTKEGQLQIPAQQFTYFDITKKKYSTVQTEPMIVHIDAGNQSQLPAPQPTKTESDSTDSSDTIATDQLAALAEWPWQEQTTRSLSPFLFLLMSMLLFLGSVGIVGYRLAKNYYRDHAPIINRKRAFSMARNQLERCQKKGAIGQLHLIFNQLFMHRCQISADLVTVAFMRNKLVAAGMSAEQIEQWMIDYGAMMEAAFYHRAYNDNGLYKRAAYWIAEFERIV